MRKVFVKICAIAVVVASLLCAEGRLLLEVNAAEEVYPFWYEKVEQYLSDIWVGDKLTLKNEYTYEILEGANIAEVRYGEKPTIYFEAEGIVQLKVVRNSDGAERVFEFEVGPAKQLKHEYLIPQTIKIGHKLSGEWFAYSNCLLEQAIGVVDITVPNYDDYCVMPGNNFGYGGWDWVSRDVVSLMTNTEQQWLFGTPTKPGIMYYTTELEPNKQYAIKIEEPVIETNFPKEIVEGSSMEIWTSLKNTELTDKKIQAVKKLIEQDSDVRLYELIGYQPRVEVISGSDLINRVGGDYSNTLSSSEKIEFKKTGTVVFKVTYEMLPISTGEHRNFKSTALYSPEETFTVEIVKEQPIQNNENKADTTIDTETSNPNTTETEVEIETDIVLDYTNAPPTSETLLNIIADVEDDEAITINVSDSLTIDENILNELRDGNHEVVVNKVNENGNLIYSWDIDTFPNSVGAWNTGIEINAENKQITEQLEYLKHDGTSTTINFEHQGKLPGKANVKLFVGDKFEKEEKLFYYYYNEKSKNFERIGDYIVDDNGYVKVEMEHCSDYILTNSEIGVETPEDTELDTIPQEPNADQGESNMLWTLVGICGICLVIFIGIILMKKKQII